MIPLAVPDLTGRESEYLAECIETTFVSSVGPFVERLETMVAAAAGSRFAVATASGTSALHMSLLAVGVGRNDLVIMPSYTFVASANAVRHAGADPWLLDVSPESWTLDPAGLAHALRGDCTVSDHTVIHRGTGRRVSAVMPVYTAGHPADMDALNEVAASYGLPVVSDAAAAIGATYRGRALGPLARVSAFSFNGNKTITSGGGGAVVTDDEAVATRIRHVSTTARRGPGYVHDEVGYNYRMTNLQAAVGVAQLERMDSLVAAKRRIAETYAEAFSTLVEAFPHAAWAQSSDWMSGIVLPADASKNVDEVVAELQSEGVDGRGFWVPMHHQPPYANCLRSDLTVTDSFAGRVLTLPCSSALASHEQDRVIDAVTRAMRTWQS